MKSFFQVSGSLRRWHNHLVYYNVAPSEIHPFVIASVRFWTSFKQWHFGLYARTFEKNAHILGLRKMIHRHGLPAKYDVAHRVHVMRYVLYVVMKLFLVSLRYIMFLLYSRLCADVRPFKHEGMLFGLIRCYLIRQTTYFWISNVRRTQWRSLFDVSAS